MSTQKSRFRLWLKATAIVVVCLFTLNNLVWANPDLFSSNTNAFNLAAPNASSTQWHFSPTRLRAAVSLVANGIAVPFEEIGDICVPVILHEDKKRKITITGSLDFENKYRENGLWVIPLDIKNGQELEQKLEAVFTDNKKLVELREADEYKKLLGADYVEYDMTVKKIVNPDDKPLRAIYGGAGADISHFLLSTNAREAYFVAGSKKHKEIPGAGYEFTADNMLEMMLRADLTPSSYLEGKKQKGYVASPFVVSGGQVASAISFELQAILGIKFDDIKIDSNDGHPRISFKWTYPGTQKEETYSITFISADITARTEYPPFLEKVIAGGVDIYYQKAGVGIPEHYRDEDSFISHIIDNLNEGGFTVTDDHAYESEKLEERGFLFKYVDRSSDFPTDQLTEIPIEGIESIKESILEERKACAVYRDNRIEVRYGWDLRIRKKAPQVKDGHGRDAEINLNPTKKLPPRSTYDLPREIFGGDGSNLIDLWQEALRSIGLDNSVIAVAGSAEYLARNGILPWNAIRDIDLKIYLPQDTPSSALQQHANIREAFLRVASSHNYPVQAPGSIFQTVSDVTLGDKNIELTVCKLGEQPTSSHVLFAFFSNCYGNKETMRHMRSAFKETDPDRVAYHYHWYYNTEFQRYRESGPNTGSIEDYLKTLKVLIRLTRLIGAHDVEKELTDTLLDFFERKRTLSHQSDEYRDFVREVMDAHQKFVNLLNPGKIGYDRMNEKISAVVEKIRHDLQSTPTSALVSTTPAAGPEDGGTSYAGLLLMVPGSGPEILGYVLLGVLAYIYLCSQKKAIIDWLHTKGYWRLEKIANTLLLDLSKKSKLKMKGGKDLDIVWTGKRKKEGLRIACVQIELPSLENFENATQRMAKIVRRLRGTLGKNAPDLVVFPEEAGDCTEAQAEQRMKSLEKAARDAQTSIGYCVDSQAGTYYYFIQPGGEKSKITRYKKEWSYGEEDRILSINTPDGNYKIFTLICAESGSVLSIEGNKEKFLKDAREANLVFIPSYIQPGYPSFTASMFFHNFHRPTIVLNEGGQRRGGSFFSSEKVSGALIEDESILMVDIVDPDSRYGPSLKELVLSGSISYEELRETLFEVMQNLARRHETGRCLDNVTFENIYLREDGTPAFSDLCVEKPIAEDEEVRSDTRSLLNSIHSEEVRSAIGDKNANILAMALVKFYPRALHEKQGYGDDIGDVQESWKGIPAEAVKSILYPACGHDARGVLEVMEGLPQVEEVHLLDDNSQHPFKRIKNYFYSAFEQIASEIEDSGESPTDDNRDILMFRFKNERTLKTVKVYFHKHDYLKTDRIRGMEDGSDLTIVKFPGFGSSLASDYNTEFYRRVYGHTKKYIYVRNAPSPKDEELLQGLEIVECYVRPGREHVLLSRGYGDLRQLENMVYAEEYAVYHKKEEKGRNIYASDLLNNGIIVARKDVPDKPPRQTIIRACEISELKTEELPAVIESLKRWLDSKSDMDQHIPQITEIIKDLEKARHDSTHLPSRMNTKRVYLALSDAEATGSENGIEVEGLLEVDDRISGTWFGTWEIRLANRDKNAKGLRFIGVGRQLLRYAVNREVVRPKYNPGIAFGIWAEKQLDAEGLRPFTVYMRSGLCGYLRFKSEETLEILEEAADSGDKGAEEILRQLTEGTSPKTPDARNPEPAERADVHDAVLVNGTKLHYRTMGRDDAPAIVVVHGGPGFDHNYLLASKEGTVNPFLQLAKKYRVIFYDQRASGESGGREDLSLITVDNFVDDIEGIRKAFGLEKVHLMGHSWGGLLAMLYAARRPDKVRSLTLFHPMPEESSKLRESRIRRSERWKADGFDEKDTDQPDYWEGFFAPYVYRKEDVSGVGRFLRPRIKEDMKVLFKRLRRFLMSYNITEELAQISCPTLIISGEHDLVSLRGLGESMDRAEMHEIQKCGHFSFFELPDEFFNSVSTFLEEVSDKTPAAGAEAKDEDHFADIRAAIDQTLELSGLKNDAESKIDVSIDENIPKKLRVATHRFETAFSLAVSSLLKNVRDRRAPSIKVYIQDERLIAEVADKDTGIDLEKLESILRKNTDDGRVLIDKTGELFVAITPRDAEQRIKAGAAKRTARMEDVEQFIRSSGKHELPFVRYLTSKGRSKLRMHGMGLRLARAYITDIGGNLTYTTGPQGTTFTSIIPLSTSAPYHKGTGQAAGAEEKDLPDGSPLEIYKLLKAKFKGKWVAPEKIHKINGLSVGHTIKRDLRTLVFLGLVERETREKGKKKEVKYRVADLSPPKWKIVEPVLTGLGRRPTKDQKEAAKTKILPHIRKTIKNAVLTPDERRVLKLLFDRKLSWRESAKVMGISAWQAFRLKRSALGELEAALRERNENRVRTRQRREALYRILYKTEKKLTASALTQKLRKIKKYRSADKYLVRHDVRADEYLSSHPNFLLKEGRRITFGKALRARKDKLLEILNRYRARKKRLTVPELMKKLRRLKKYRDVTESMVWSDVRKYKRLWSHPSLKIRKHKKGKESESTPAAGADAEEKQLAGAFNEFAELCRENIRLIRQHVEEEHYDAIPNCVTQIEQGRKDIFAHTSDQDFLNNAMSPINAISFALIGEPDKEAINTCLDEIVEVFVELEKLMAAGRLRDAFEARVRSGVLDASLVLNPQGADGAEGVEDDEWDEKDSGNKGSGPTAGDFGMLIVATAGASSISPWLGIIVGILACYALVSTLADMSGSRKKGDEPEPTPAVNEARAQEILKEIGFVFREGETLRYTPVYEPRLWQIRSQLTPSDYSALFDYFWNRSGTGLAFPKELKAKLIPVWWSLPKCYMSCILNGSPDGGVIAHLLKMEIITDEEEQFLWKLFHLRAPAWSNRSLAELRKIAPRMMDAIDAEIVRAKRPVRVLELGCGPKGQAIRDLKSYHGDKIEVFGVDWDIPDENIEGVTLKQANIRDLPFADNFFDLIYEYLALDALTGEPLKKSISEAIRVLAPGGKLIISQSIKPEAIRPILDSLGIDYEITEDEPFIITKKATSDKPTPAPYHKGTGQAAGAEEAEEKQLAEMFAGFAEMCREKMRIMRHDIEKDNYDAVKSAIRQIHQEIKRIFADSLYEEVRLLLRDSLQDFATIQTFLPINSEKEVFYGCLDRAEAVLVELEKLMAAGRLLDAKKAWVRSGLLDASLVLDPSKTPEKIEPAAGAVAADEKEEAYTDHDTKVLSDLLDKEELPKCLLEMLVGLNSNNKVVFAFDEELADGRDGNPLQSFLKALKNLKNNKKYEKILQNLEIIPAPVEDIPALLEEYKGQKHTKVFTFAREIKESKEALSDLEEIDDFQVVYINENKMPENAYYPLAEIVTITLAQVYAPGIINADDIKSLIEGKLKISLAELNIYTVRREGKALIFTLLPDAEEMNYQQLIYRYAELKRFLKSA